jgi:Domain of unknown function (DUF4129)
MAATTFHVRHGMPAVAVYLLAVPTALGAQGVVRRRRASTAATKVRLAWTDALDAAAAVGVPLPVSLTVAEIADRLANVTPGAADSVRTMAWQMDRLVYAEVAPTADGVAAAVRAGAVVRDALEARLSLGQRIVRRLDVRRLRPPRGRPDPRRTRPAWAGLRE